MGFFDKLFGKGKKNDEQSEKAEQIIGKDESEDINAENGEAQETASENADDSSENATEKTAEEAPKADTQSSEKVTAAVEMFPVKKDSVTAERSAEICTRFINNALARGEELKKADLQMLSYNELCLLYNNMQLMTLRMDAKLKAVAGVVIGNNTKVIRVCILEKLKKQTLYSLYTKVNRMPFVNSGALYIFTVKELAEKQVAESDIKYLVLKEIPEAQLEAHLDAFYMTGYKEVIVDLGTKIPLSDLYKAKEPAAYGIINPLACGKMIFFSQMTATFAGKAKEESRKITDEENAQVNRIWQDITETLIRSVLLLPAEKTEDGKIQLKGISVKSPEGQNWIAMFTDQLALNTFFKSNQPSAGIKNPILSQFAAIKDKPEIEGIIVNPGRESFRIPSKVLASRTERKMPDENERNGDKTE
ncbi:MAG: SseB family protein [Clostridia bacterium]|nr:SseB family protein [Clostridia bacterium]